MRDIFRPVVFLVLVPSLAAAGQVFRVGPGGTHATVQQAMSDAVAAGGETEIRVATGTYVGQVKVYAAMKSGAISISGGWDASFALRAAEPGRTVLDGGGTGSTLYLNPDGGTVTLENLTITGGRAATGGGINAWGPKGASFNILDCRIVGNTATDETMPIAGAGISLTMAGAGTAHIARTVIAGNTGSSQTQRAFGGGFNLRVAGTAQVLLEDSEITGNSLSTPGGRSEGSGLYAEAAGAASITLRGVAIARNTVAVKEGSSAVGTYLGSGGTSRIVCTRSCFLDNTGGTDPTGTRNLWIAAHDESKVAMSEVVIAGGTRTGVELAVDPAAVLALANCTIARNAGHGVTGQATSIHNTIVFGNGIDGNLSGTPTVGGNLVGIDPMFVNAELHDFRLLPGSPAIDKGVQPPEGMSQDDFSGLARVACGAVDVGAHEYRGQAVLHAAALAHTTGFGGTPWRSDLDLANLSKSPADLMVRFENANGKISKTVTLAPVETRAWPDVLTSLFGFGATAKVSGSLRVEDPSGAVVAAVRTYADGGAAGTYGQGYPSMPDGSGITAGEVGVLPMVKSNASYYSNIGVLALGQTPVQARVTLVDANGSMLGTPLTLSADPGRWVQADDVFTRAGASSAEVAYATVEPLTQGGRVWGAASVIDRATKDPTTVEATIAAPPGTVQRVAAVAHGPGFSGTAWRSTVAVVNTSGAVAKATLTFSGATTIVRTVTVPAHGAVEWPDVLVGLFGLGAQASGLGALEVVADAAVVVSCRTYADKGADGTFGQSYPALVARRGIGAGEAGMLPQLRKHATAYTNVGALGLSTVPCTAIVQLQDAQGNPIGSPQTISTQPGGFAQISDIFKTAGAGEADEAYAGIRVTTEGCRMWFYASVIDSLTRDPTTIELARPFVVEPGR